MPFMPRAKPCEICATEFIGLPTKRFCSLKCKQAASVRVRFWSRVRKTESCWLWAGPLTYDGYGRIMAFGKRMGAHRYSYIIHNADFDHEREVCHKCDTPACVNPSHLFLGTHHENMIDAQAKGRWALNEKPFRTHLRGADLAAEVRRLRSTGLSQQAIANALGIGQTNVSRILRA